MKMLLIRWVGPRVCLCLLTVLALAPSLNATANEACSPKAAPTEDQAYYRNRCLGELIFFHALEAIGPVCHLATIRVNAPRLEVKINGRWMNGAASSPYFYDSRPVLAEGSTAEVMSAAHIEYRTPGGASGSIDAAFKHYDMATRRVSLTIQGDAGPQDFLLPVDAPQDSQLEFTKDTMSFRFTLRPLSAVYISDLIWPTTLPKAGTPIGICYVDRDGIDTREALAKWLESHEDPTVPFAEQAAYEFAKGMGRSVAQLLTDSGDVQTFVSTSFPPSYLKACRARHGRIKGTVRKLLFASGSPERWRGEPWEIVGGCK